MPDKEPVDNKKCDDIFVVIPAFNEGPMLNSVLAQLGETSYQVVVIDDGSSDNTGTIAQAHTPHFIRHLVNRGQGAALQTGIEYALLHGANIIATFDADGQHRIEDMDRMIRAVEAHECDAALGSRFLDSDHADSVPTGRKLLLRTATLVQLALTGARLSDAHNGLRVLSRKAATQVQLTNDRMAHASEVIDQLFKGDLVIREYPVKITYTDYSQSKGQSWTGGFRILFHYLISRVFG